MGVLRRIETRIAHVFEGIFNRSSRDGIPAVEIARRLVEELEEHKVFRNGGTIVPSTYTLYLSGHDRALLRSYEYALVEELKTHLLQHARSEGYQTDVPPEVDITTDTDLKKGSFGILTHDPEAVAGESGEANAGSSVHGETQDIPAHVAEDLSLARQVLVLECGDLVKEFSAGRVVVGRSSSADFRLEDLDVSRRHAEFFWDGGRIFVQDLDSTNGTYLNGLAVGSTAVSDGDVVSLGNNKITIRTET